MTELGLYRPFRKTGLFSSRLGTSRRRVKISLFYLWGSPDEEGRSFLFVGHRSPLVLTTRTAADRTRPGRSTPVTPSVGGPCLSLEGNYTPRRDWRGRPCKRRVPTPTHGTRFASEERPGGQKERQPTL